MVLNETTLPTFRIAGMARTASRDHASRIAQTLREEWTSQPLDLPAFSQTIYVAYQYPDTEHCHITIGKLIPLDATLPENVADVWIAPQQYAVFDVLGDVADIWAQIAQNTALKRRFLVDFETYPASGLPRVYVGMA